MMYLSFFVTWKRKLDVILIDNPKGSDLQEILSGIKNNEDVSFHWSMLSLELDDEIATELRDRIIQLYVTVRGHAFANSCLELFKQSKQKTIQKTKGTRSKVQQDSNS